MNFTPVQWTHLPETAATNRVGSSLDITPNDPATPEPVSSTRAQNTAVQIGSISGVLSSEENQAIASMFESTRQQLYTFEGTSRKTPSIPGKHIDFIA